ncbi:Uncharacterised protein [BD1-7 clade bacterium]|uniref:Uncharacterized protein n=1 Tax=BD1-7 clade bacterium TaxID=2029982 RepID=A0A5S9Q6M4_9GAMM|nr:Uncharacterised protein [BD1-7 clade bacterium]
MISDKFNRDENPNWEPDALVEFIFFGRSSAVKNGYRPTYRVNGDYLTSTFHWFIDNGKAEPNIPTQAFVKFITPEAYPNCLKEGMILDVIEVPNKVGEAKIIEVYNKQLKACT